MTSGEGPQTGFLTLHICGLTASILQQTLHVVMMIVTRTTIVTRFQNMPLQRHVEGPRQLCGDAPATWSSHVLVPRTLQHAGHLTENGQCEESV